MKEQLETSKVGALELAQKYSDLCQQRRRDAAALHRVATGAQEALQQLGLPPSHLRDLDFDSLITFFDGLVGKLDALPL